jgi:hypothetical protein
VSAADFEKIYAKADENGRIIGGLMKYLRQSDIRGVKFK